MSLQVWLPLNGDLHNQGLKNYNLNMFRGTEVYDNNGKIGKCFYANGVNTIKILNIIPDFYNYSSYSLCAWFYIEAQNTTHSGSAIISAGNWNNQLLNLAISDWSTDHYTRLRISGANWNTTYNYNFQINTWYHAVVSSDGNKTYAYINGQLIGNTAAGFLPTSIEGNDMCIGGATYYAGMQFFGKINDVRIYDHCLSPKEVEEISKGLILHYKLDDPCIDKENLVPVSYWQGSKTTSLTANTTSYGIINYPSMSVKVNTTYFWSIELRVISGGENLTNIAIDTNCTGGSYSGNDSAHTVISTKNPNLTELKTGKWQTAYCITTVKSDATNPQIFHCIYGASSTATTLIVEWRNLMLIESSTVTPFRTWHTSIIYDSSGYNNNGTKWNYDSAGEITIINEAPRYAISTYINSSDNTTNTASGTQYIYGNCELTTPQYLTCAFWCKPVAGYGGNVGQGQFSLTNNEIGNNAGSDYQAGPMNHRDSIVDINNAAGNTHKTVSIGFVANEWHHFAIVYDGRYARVYKDGTQTSTADMGSTMALGSMKGAVIGFSKAGGVWRSNKSYFSDFRLYATALTATQIKELYDTSVSIDSFGNIHAREVVEI